MSAMGELNFFLGLQVLQKKDDIFLSQDKYVGDILKKFGYSDVRIFRYLKGHPKLGLRYPKESPFDLVAYLDSDYGGVTQDRKSTTEGCQFLGRRLISWQCKKQTIMDTSTTKAEYVAAASGCGQVLWIQNQLLDYGHHFIRDCFENKLISVDHIHTDDNVADLLTKPFDAGRFQYALTINPTVYVSHIQQFWSTARIETTDEGTKILATVDGFNEFSSNFATAVIVDFVEASHLRIETTDEGTKILATVDGKLRTISESSIKRNLKLRGEVRISSLPDAELFENLTLMGYNILPNQKFSFQKGRTVPLFPSMLVTMGEGSGTPNDPHHTPSPEAQQTSHTTHLSPSLSPVTTEPLPTVIPFDTPQLRQYTKELRLLSSQLFHLVRLLEDREGGSIAQSREDAPIKGRSLDEREEVAIERSMEKGSNNTEEMINVLTSLDAAIVLSSGFSVSISPVTEVSVAEVPTGSGSIPTSSPPSTGVPTDSGMVPTASFIFTTATVATPYTRRKGKEKMGYHQFAAELSIGRRIELIGDLVKYQDNYAKVLKFQTQQRKPLSRKQHGDFYISVLRSHAEESERFKKRLRLEHDNAKKVKTSEEVPEENLKEMMQLIPVEEVYVEALQVKHPIIDWEVHTKRQRRYWKIIRLGGSTASYQFFVDLLKHFYREDLNQLWVLVKETLNIRPAANDKEKELCVKLKRLYELDVEDILGSGSKEEADEGKDGHVKEECEEEVDEGTYGEGEEEAGEG
nr:hypothetical protein [Tanacetum cinerariifolium]